MNIVEPQSRKVLVFRSTSEFEEYDEEDTLQGQGVLEGFAIGVADIFG